MARIQTPAKDVKPGDKLRVLDESGQITFIDTGAIVDLGDGKTGIPTPHGMISVGSDDVVTVRRPD